MGETAVWIIYANNGWNVIVYWTKAENCLQTLQTWYFYNTPLKLNMYMYLDTIDHLGYLISLEYHAMIGEPGQSLILW